ncbi:5-methyltetrahydropteroyltriglutamate--homocysteine S-methyltransferase [Agromyces seonyuensis]|uniref:5-methyltetrahydropteroyltriglutamate--homocysteine S-methyltransferase n=1 Tax=Agromyces seonyuensis TaxID=2662446 RepID=A0A6I4NZI7_9MICO|nr:5-methyltetrahydropteroyltriglutamate--homocysteine S-methyltransferase [Agromyces seonyuensis]MWB99571.1 5-methyltetrahydropteroyltriglutamate--homocysteine S-methyltransferase [Agromyces seonyuensis]
MSVAFPGALVLGYPRIGPNRELKRAVESYWAGQLDADGLEAAAAELRAATRSRLVELGLGREDSSLPETFSFSDQVLDALLAVGAVPGRFAGLAGLDLLFALARGTADVAPLELTKWFDTNYHHLVPEIGPDTDFSFADDRRVREVAEARAAGFVTRPVLVGPVTLLALAKRADGAPDGFVPIQRLDDLLPVYAELLAALADAGADWVQLDEPVLVSDAVAIDRAELRDATARAYETLGSAPRRPGILVATPYGDPRDALPVLAAAPIEAIGLDLVRGRLPEHLDAAAEEGLAGKAIAAGVVDGRNVWRADLDAALDRLEQAGRFSGEIAVSTSTSLQHVPHDVARENALEPALVGRLAFADQKVAEVALLARGLAEGREAIATELTAAAADRAAGAAADGVRVAAVRARTVGIGESDSRRVPYSERLVAQTGLGLPPLPTTTIGSFPQTPEVRRARAALARGESSAEAYDARMREEIERVIRLQEQLGLDVLVHGEPERNDMVQYFAERLDGFTVTEHGWVQSYGSRCTRPSILWGDVSRPAPMTVEWSRYAASLTDKPVKGMLTGPVTILAWSFVRDDQPLGDTARQVALALRDEIADLEAVGLGVIQVDEPALRELLPLEHARREAYLEWAVGAFRLATGGAAASTQVHTHLCYSEFGAVIDAVRDLDADVTSIEAARSRMEVVDELAAAGFDHGIGPGVWDIHSPRVPSSDELVGLLELAARRIEPGRLWVNPDCGLKTRGYEETVATLRNLVDAAARVRAELALGA